ncbi:MAG: exosortase/archaeosortase family protein [Nitrospira sp.]|nr:exosortase/archaeosortase family protein [Nitrospira sp.]
MALADQMNTATSIPDKDQIMSENDGRKSQVGTLSFLSRPLPFSPSVRNGLILFLVAAACAVFWHPFLTLYTLSQEQEHYSHIVLIPLVSLYVLYGNRTAILASREWSPVLGVVLIGSGGLGYGLSNAAGLGSDSLSMTMASFVVICWGIFLLGYGAELFRQGLFGLLFLLFMVPLPEVLLSATIQFLQRMSAEASDVIFGLLGVPVFREGFSFSLTNFSVHVAEECSGIRSFLSLIITVLVAGHFFLRSFWTKLGIVAFVIPLAIIKNAFRIVGLTLLANYVDPAYITNSVLHSSGGIPLFGLSLVVLFSLIWLLRRVEQRMGYGTQKTCITSEG